MRCEMKKMLLSTAFATAALFGAVSFAQPGPGPEGPKDGPRGEQKERPDFNRGHFDRDCDGGRDCDGDRECPFRGDGPDFQAKDARHFAGPRMPFMDGEDRIEIKKVVRFMKHLDANDDGFICPQERKAFFEKMKKDRPDGCREGHEERMKEGSSCPFPPRQPGFWREGDAPNHDGARFGRSEMKKDGKGPRPEMKKDGKGEGKHHFEGDRKDGPRPEMKKDGKGEGKHHFEGDRKDGPRPEMKKDGKGEGKRHFEGDRKDGPRPEMKKDGKGEGKRHFEGDRKDGPRPEKKMKKAPQKGPEGPADEQGPPPPEK